MFLPVLRILTDSVYKRRPDIYFNWFDVKGYEQLRIFMADAIYILARSFHVLQANTSMKQPVQSIEWSVLF